MDGHNMYFTSAFKVEVALEHSRVLAIFCTMVFTSDHPCIESIQCAHCTMDGLKWKPCYKKSRVLASARMPPLMYTSNKLCASQSKMIYVLCLDYMYGITGAS